MIFSLRQAYPILLVGIPNVFGEMDMSMQTDFVSTAMLVDVGHLPKMNLLPMAKIHCVLQVNLFGVAGAWCARYSVIH